MPLFGGASFGHTMNQQTPRVAGNQWEHLVQVWAKRKFATTHHKEGNFYVIKLNCRKLPWDEDTKSIFQVYLYRDGDLSRIIATFKATEFSKIMQEIVCPFEPPKE